MWACSHIAWSAETDKLQKTKSLYFLKLFSTCRKFTGEQIWSLKEKTRRFIPCSTCCGSHSSPYHFLFLAQQGMCSVSHRSSRYHVGWAQKKSYHTTADQLCCTTHQRLAECIHADISSRLSCFAGKESMVGSQISHTSHEWWYDWLGLIRQSVRLWVWTHSARCVLVVSFWTSASRWLCKHPLRSKADMRTGGAAATRIAAGMWTNLFTIRPLC